MKNVLKVFRALGLKKAIRPILKYGLYKDGFIQISNLDTNIELPLEIENAKNYTMISLLALEKAEKLDFKNLRIEDDQLIDIETGISIKNLYEDSQDFPVFENIDSTEFNKININHEDVAKVAKATASERSRYAINGIAFYSTGDIVATDGRRLHCIKGNKEASQDNEVCILPYDVASIANIFKFDNNNGVLRFSKDNGTAILSGEWGVAKFKKIAGRYPDYKNIIPKKNKIEMSTDGLLTILKKIKKASSGDEKKSIVFNDGVIWNDTKFPFNVPENLEIRLNFNYLIDALEAVKPEKIYFKDNHSAVKIGNKRSLAIVTPIHLTA